MFLFIPVQIGENILPHRCCGALCIQPDIASRDITGK
jgi:hypothetical protein